MAAARTSWAPWRHSTPNSAVAPAPLSSAVSTGTGAGAAPTSTTNTTAAAAAGNPPSPALHPTATVGPALHPTAASAAAALADAYPEFARLKLRPDDVAAMASIYASMDITRTGRVAMPEFYRFIAIEPTPFAFRVFHVMDEDGSGAICFRDFVLSVWNYCTLDASALTRFAFTCYDADVSGHLDAAALKDLVREMYGDKYSLNSRVMAVFNEVGWGEKLRWGETETGITSGLL